MMEIFVGGKQRAVWIEYKRNRNLYLRVMKDGNLHVTCPRRFTQKEIRAFILEKEDWIQKTEAKQEKKQETTSYGLDGENIMWMGKEYPVRYEAAQRSFLMTEDNEIVFYLKQKTEDEIFRTFYEGAAKQILEMVKERREEWDQKICKANGKPLPRITVKYMTSRWGSCTPAHRSISISSRLIHYPSQCLDYVLLHEYAHILELNHSKAFWDIVEKFMPEYKAYKNLLK